MLDCDPSVSHPKSQIESRWSYQADRMFGLWKAHPRAGWGQVSSPPGAPGNVVVFSHSHFRGEIDLSKGPGQNIGS